MNWETISKDNLPDSDTLVLVANAEEPNYAELVYLEHSDDSEGHGEAYWEDANDTGREFDLNDFTHWCLYVPPSA